MRSEKVEQVVRKRQTLPILYRGYWESDLLSQNTGEVYVIKFWICKPKLTNMGGFPVCSASLFYAPSTVKAVKILTCPCEGSVFNREDTTKKGKDWNTTRPGLDVAA